MHVLAFLKKKKKKERQKLDLVEKKNKMSQKNKQTNKQTNNLKGLNWGTAKIF